MTLRDLPRTWARRCLAIPRFCQETLGINLRGSRLVIAYSTGLDSTALLYLLHSLAPSQNLTLIAAHAHHGLRPEADQEEAHARQVCARLGIVCETIRLGLENKPGLEEQARTRRYEFLESVRLAHKADWIVTGHHGDDLVEDILMRLVRGTGWPGLGGMPGADPARCLLRPLLDWSKDALRQMLVESGIAWCEDASNISVDFTRNRFRQAILPLLRAENPNVNQTMLHLWHLARLDASYWDSVLPAATVESSREVWLSPLPEHQAARLRLYKKALDSLGPGQVLAGHLFLLDRLWRARKKDCLVQFPGDKAARIEQSGIRFLIQEKERVTQRIQEGT